MKKILVFIDWYEPGFKAGGPIRSVKNLVDHLKGKAHFFIVTSDTDYQTTTPYSEVEADTWVKLEEGVHAWYISRENRKAVVIQDLIHEQSWDAVYLNGIFSWYYTILPLWFLRAVKFKAKTIVAPRGMLAAGALGVKGAKKKIFLSLCRCVGLFKNVRFHATHPGEAIEIQKHLVVKEPIVTALNLPAKLPEISWRSRTKVKGAAKLVSIARISPEKNIKFAIEALKFIPPAFAVQYHLYGPINDQVYWLQCQEVIKSLPNHIELLHQGSIPNEEVPATLRQYHMMLLPSLGENYGHIIVEALTAATPVLISNKTPWQDLQQTHSGWALPLENPELFTEKIAAVAAMDQAQYDLLSKNAYTYAQKIVDDQEILRKYYSLFQL